MSEQEIYNKIVEIYKTEKGKNFIAHLVRAFFPINKALFMFGFEEDKKREMKCCITGEKVYSKEDLMKLVLSNKEHNIFFERLKINAHEVINGEKIEASAELKKFEEESLEMKRKLAIISEQSDKVFSQIAFQQFSNFVMTESLRDNKHIGWVLNSERSKLFVDDGLKKGWIKDKKEQKVVEKVVSHSRLSLGDNETLQKLKKRLLNEK